MTKDNFIPFLEFPLKRSHLLVPRDVPPLGVLHKSFEVLMSDLVCEKLEGMPLPIGKTIPRELNQQRVVVRFEIQEVKYKSFVEFNSPLNIDDAFVQPLMKIFASPCVRVPLKPNINKHALVHNITKIIHPTSV